ncbi:hypothetical protein ABH521_011300 [Staphylococcus warneri]|uniref:hypothetical protein n=1 Tax=Staphylococcus warneri TaxID=1292 RepID=UPI003260912C
MKLNKELIENYLRCVNDKNPIHAQVVPGQLVCDIAMFKLKQQWLHYTVKYIQTIDIDEDLSFSLADEKTVIVWNEEKGVKLSIFKNR